MAELRSIIEFHGRHFVHHLEILNPICVKLLKVMFGIVPRNLKNGVSISNRFMVSTNTAYRHIRTHDDSNRRNVMRCISPKNVNNTFNDLFDFLNQMAPLKVAPHE